MMLLAVTGHTWLVTFLGFGIVLVLLTVFVFVMQGLGWVMQRIEKATVPAAAPAVKQAVAAQETGVAAQTDDTIAVAYALHLFYGLHDADSPRLTLHQHLSIWNEKTFGINNLDR